jgi:hypothetical protein
VHPSVARSDVRQQSAVHRRCSEHEPALWAPRRPIG